MSFKVFSFYITRTMAKLRFQENGEELPRKVEMVRFFTMITLYRPENCEYKG